MTTFALVCGIVAVLAWAVQWIDLIFGDGDLS